MMKKAVLFVWILLLSIGITGSISAQDAEDVEAADYLYFFGGGGGFPGSTEGIRGLVVWPDGNVLVADVFQHISEFNMYGELVEVHETDAAGNGFGDMNAMVGDPSGNVYVATDDPVAINVYDSAWNLTQTITPEGQFQMQGSLAYDATNALLYAALTVPGEGENEFQIVVVGYNAAGEIEGEIPLQLAFPHPNQYIYGGITVDAEGNVVHSYGGVSRGVGDLNLASGAIQVYQPDGELLSQLNSATYIEEETATTEGTETFRYYATPYGITLDSAGRIYAYEVQVLVPIEFGQPMRISGLMTITAPNGALLRQFPVSQSDTPQGAKLALSPDESLLYVATANYVHIIGLTSEPPFTSVEMAENGRLRATPVDGAVVDSVPAGTILLVTGQNDAGDWLQVRYQGGEAWVAEFLTQPLER